MTSKKTILIAEDNDSNFKLVNDILQSYGYNVIAARDGEEAINKIKENYKAIDLILMDIQLPKINGLDAIKIIKENDSTKDIPIFVVSAHAMAQDIEKAKQAGCVEYITKPIKLVEFIQKINNYLKP